MELIYHVPQNFEIQSDKIVFKTRKNVEYEYQVKKFTFTDFYNYFKSNNLPIVIDDRIASYCIAGIKKENNQIFYRILDPHYGLSYGIKQEQAQQTQDFDYGPDDGKDTWKPASFIENKKWLMLFVYQPEN